MEEGEAYGLRILASVPRSICIRSIVTSVSPPGAAVPFVHWVLLQSPSRSAGPLQPRCNQRLRQSNKSHVVVPCAPRCPLLSCDGCLPGVGPFVVQWPASDTLTPKSNWMLPPSTERCPGPACLFPFEASGHLSSFGPQGSHSHTAIPPPAHHPLSHPTGRCRPNERSLNYRPETLRARLLQRTGRRERGSRPCPVYEVLAQRYSYNAKRFRVAHLCGKKKPITG